MINHLRYVTKKLKDQSLDETQHIHDKVNKSSEDKDSGTESDEEEPSEEPELASEISSEVSSGCSVKSRPTSQTSTDTLTCDDLPMAGDAPEMPPPFHTSTTSFNPSSAVYLSLGSHPQNRRARTPRSTSAARNRDVIYCHSLPDYVLECIEQPLSEHQYVCDGIEYHSSEEELEPLTASWGREVGPSEKRKWSEVARRSLTDSVGSSDDEVSTLTAATHPPVQFRTSPPRELPKPMLSSSPPSKMRLAPSTNGASCKGSERLSPGSTASSGENENSRGGSRMRLAPSVSGTSSKALEGSSSGSSTSSGEGESSRGVRLRLTPLASGTSCKGLERVSPGSSTSSGEGESSRGATPRHDRANSPRKRSKPQRLNRPCLDFEKMQQKKDRAVTQWRNGGELSLSYC